MYQALREKKNKLAVIGLGYVGLTVALEFAKKLSVIGFDINADRIKGNLPGHNYKQGLLKLLKF